jgi:hypothetical protein
MFDSSQLPNVDDLGLKHPVEVAYASHMAARENALHAIFGPTDPPDEILSPGDPNLFINWSGGGIYQYPPGHGRRSWHYVTSGLSQPPIDGEGTAESIEDEDGERYSGFGIELVLSTSGKAAWAPHVLVNLVKYLLFQKNARVILPGDRIPCNGPLVLDTNTQLTHLVATTSDEYETEIRLPAGKCHLVHLVGATQQEVSQALTLGNRIHGHHLPTLRSRFRRDLVRVRTPHPLRLRGRCPISGRGPAGRTYDRRRRAASERGAKRE